VEKVRQKLVKYVILIKMGLPTVIGGRIAHDYIRYASVHHKRTDFSSQVIFSDAIDAVTEAFQTLWAYSV